METPQDPKKGKKKNNGVKRVYSSSDAVMLTAALVILKAAAEPDIQPKITARRSRYDAAAIGQLTADVETAIKVDLGLDPVTIVQQLSQAVYDAQDSAQAALSEFNLDLKDSFPGQPKAPRLLELRALLGLRDHYETARGDNQQALTELLAKFVGATNDPALRAELQDDLDISADVINRVRTHANFATLDVAQETGKGQSRTITDDTVRKFNDLYERVMVIARLGRNLHKAQPSVADRFSFSAVRRKMRGGA